MLKIHLTKPVSKVKVSEISMLELPFFTLKVSMLYIIVHVALYHRTKIIYIESFKHFGKI